MSSKTVLRRGKQVPNEWELHLYLANETPRSLVALANLKKICEQHLSGRYQIKVIDLLKSPHLSREDQVIAVPTLIRKRPEPVRRIIGDLSNTEQVLRGLQISFSVAEVASSNN